MRWSGCISRLVVCALLIVVGVCGILILAQRITGESVLRGVLTVFGMLVAVALYFSPSSAPTSPAPRPPPVTVIAAAPASTRVEPSPEDAATQAMNAGEGKKAVMLWLRVIADDPTNAKAHYQLAVAHMMNGDNAKAKASFQRFLEMAPQDPLAAQTRDVMSRL